MMSSYNSLLKYLLTYQVHHNLIRKKSGKLTIDSQKFQKSRWKESMISKGISVISRSEIRNFRI